MSEIARTPDFEITFERILAHHDDMQMGIAKASFAVLFQDFLYSSIAVVVGVFAGAGLCISQGWSLETYFICVAVVIGVALLTMFVVPNFIGDTRLPFDLFLVAENGSFIGACTVRAYKDTLSETKNNAQRVYNWSAILKLYRSRSHILLFTDRAEAIYIPIDAFISDEELDGFCAFCEDKISKLIARQV
ncbi:MAG: hypothetical protein CMK07_03155 [Ponticaulis sp.]|nr:hypothetical protein [Ponticaulis sp.]